MLNRLSRAGVLAENMLFATLDPTTRRVVLPKKSNRMASVVEEGSIEEDSGSPQAPGRHNKGQEVLLTDTVGFISKLPTDLIAAFRATLEEVQNADVLIHVCDRSSPVWRKQRETVLKELDAIGCFDIPIVELWNKIDALPDADSVMLEAATIPIDVEATSVGEIDDSETAELALTAASDGSNEEEEDDSESEYADLSRDVDDNRHDERNNKANTSSSRYGSARPGRKIFTVAASALTGVGFDDFIGTMEDALSLLLKPIEVFIPYDKDDGLVARIHSRGTVVDIEYKNAGTRIACRVPDSLRMRLKPFKVPSPI